MTPEGASRVLAACALYDYRFGKPSTDVLLAWFQLLGDLDADDAVDAVARHYAASPDRIMPAHIRQGVKDIQAERRRREPSAPRALPSRFEDDINREVRMAEGAASVRQVLGPLLEHIASRQQVLPSAFDELRELTAGPSDADVVDGEVSE